MYERRWSVVVVVVVVVGQLNGAKVGHKHGTQKSIKEVLAAPRSDIG